MNIKHWLYICRPTVGTRTHMDTYNDTTTLWGKKLHPVPFAPFYFCNNFAKPHYILTIFGTQILK